MTSTPSSPPPRHSKPPRSKSYQSPTPKLKIQIVQLVDLNLDNYTSLQTDKQTSPLDCKYCRLKQKLARPGETSKCLAHSISVADKEQKEDPTFSPKTPPSKPKNRSYDSADFGLDLNESVDTIKALVSLAKQLSVVLKQHHQNIDFKDQPQLIQSILQLLNFIPHETRAKFLSERAYIQPQNTNHNESSIQFQLSQFQESYYQKEDDNTFKSTMAFLLKQSRLSNPIHPSIISQFVYQTDSRLKALQKTIQQYEFRVLQLTKKCSQKLSTEYSAKYTTQDSNFVDKQGDLSDTSLKDCHSVCLMCRRRNQNLNHDQMNFKEQPRTLQNLLMSN